MKKILIPNGSFHDIPLIKKAKEHGYYVITSGAAPNGLGHKYADEYVYGDFSDPVKMLEIAESKNIDKVWYSSEKTTENNTYNLVTDGKTVATATAGTSVNSGGRGPGGNRGF
jgi:hypothetical protein